MLNSQRDAGIGIDIGLVLRSCLWYTEAKIKSDVVFTLFSPESIPLFFGIGSSRRFPSLLAS